MGRGERSAGKGGPRVGRAAGRVSCRSPLLDFSRLSFQRGDRVAGRSDTLAALGAVPAGKGFCVEGRVSKVDGSPRRGRVTHTKGDFERRSGREARRRRVSYTDRGEGGATRRVPFSEEGTLGDEDGERRGGGEGAAGVGPSSDGHCISKSQVLVLVGFSLVLFASDGSLQVMMMRTRGCLLAC